MHWPARRRVGSTITGAHQSRMRGVSAEFTEYRPYRQGDDPRRVDWKLLARSDRAYIRLATDRAVLPTVIAVDGSASMAFPVPGLEKWRQACAIAVGLAAVAHADGDPAGLAMAAGDATRVLPPRSRRGVVAEIARTLDAARPSGSPMLAALIAPISSGARLAIVSDFLGDERELLRAARQRVAAGGEVHAVHVIARAELEPDTPIVAVDPEDDALRRPFGETSRAEYDAAFLEWRTELAREWRAAGAYFITVVDDEAPGTAVRRVVRGETGAPA